ncbi:RHS repeat protein [Salmonella enterica]|nr:RHS repeat protein [Salmonella enterica]
MTTTVFSGTPVIAVTDNRGLTVRALNWNRTTAGEEAVLLITHSLAADETLTVTARDPRLFGAWLKDSNAGANLTTFRSLAGQPLRRDSTDSGQDITVYDAEGRPAWSRDPAGTVMTWAYDELGRQVSVTQQITEASGTAETVTAAVFIYGDSDPLTAHPQNNNLRGVCVSQYDEGGWLTTDSVALSGAVLSASQTFLADAESLPDWPDDEAGRSTLLESTPYITTVQADALGRTCSQTDAAGHTVSMTYDVSGVPVTQSLQLKGGAAMPLLSGMTLSAAGQVLSERAGNGVTTTYSYEEDTLRLSGIAAVRGSDGAVLQSLGYVYDPVGNVISVADATVSSAWFRNQSTTGTRSFTYDALYQLISATGRENAVNGAQTSALPVMQSLSGSQTVNYTRNYTYDDSGNLVTLTHSSAVSSTMAMVTDATSNRSIRQNNDGGLTPETVAWADWFTPGGQLKTLQTEGGKPSGGYTDSADALAWDRNTRLQGVTLVNRSKTDATQNDREVYQYRGGMRVRKQTRTLTNTTSGLWTVSEVRYLPGLELRNTWQETVTGDSTSAQAYSEQLEVVSTQAGRSQVRVLHWMTPPPSDISNDQVRYGVDDNIGSLSLELDDTGQLISREEYYPFGGTAVWAARSQTEADYKTVRYSGQERDGTGLYYYGYRYYAPWLCRWTASDPAGEVDGLNLFRMVRNNPVSARDIAGLAPEDENQDSASETSVQRNPPTLRALVKNVVQDFRHYTASDVPQFLGGMNNLQGFGFAFALVHEKASEKINQMSAKKSGSNFLPLGQISKIIEKQIIKYLPVRQYSLSPPPVLNKNRSGLIGMPVRGAEKTSSIPLEKDDEGNEILYRTMPLPHYKVLFETHKLSATSETSVSPAFFYSEGYLYDINKNTRTIKKNEDIKKEEENVLIRFILKQGTVEKLTSIGGAVNKLQSPELAGKLGVLQSNWAEKYAGFKSEGNQTTIHLGRGLALEIFNSNIVTFYKFTPK